jgi:DNA-binding NarL/FixJ family response regulator
MSNLTLEAVRVLHVCVVSEDAPFASALARALTRDDVQAERLSLAGFLSRPGEDFDLAVLDLPDDEGASTDMVVGAREHIRGPVIGITQVLREAALIAPLGAGARGLVLRRSGASVIHAAIAAVSDGGVFVDPAVGGTLVGLVTIAARAESRSSLTAAELRVLSRFPRGMTNAEIADDLGISVNTVKTHVRHILGKLDSRDRVQATRVGYERGLLP